MIKPNEYIRIWPTEPMMGVTFKMVEKAHTKKEYENFCAWMGGQTCGTMANGESGIYSWDYERWLRQGKKTDQNKEDWD